MATSDGAPAGAPEHGVGAEDAGGQIPAWAWRLAQRRRANEELASHAHEEVDDWSPGAVALLWSLVDAAVAQANAALAASGLDERIATSRDVREYRLEATGWGGEQRSIAVEVGLRAVGSHVSGGAQITTSQTRARIDLVPRLEGDRPRWIVRRTGHELTPGVIDNLILSVFGDDPVATKRLDGLFSTDQD